jgi:hypothetical protein
MHHVVDAAGIGSAILFSIAFGVCVGWLGLRSLMLLMPKTVTVVQSHKSAAQKYRQAA